MEPQSFNSPDPQSTTQQPLDQPAAPQTTQPITTPTKKTHKTLIISLAIIILAFALTVGGYMVYSHFNKSTTPTAANTQPTATSPATNTTTAPTVNPTVEAAASALTGGAVSESSITSTDNTTAASDASAAATNVGASVNENNF